MVRVAILGGTKGMGRALARRMVERGDVVFLLGRSPEDLERSGADLDARGSGGGRCAGVTECDLERPAEFATALRAAREGLGGLDAVVLTAGIFEPQEELERDPVRTRRLLDVDFTFSVLFCEEARRVLLEEGGGVLCVFGSVAGDRGRKPVVLYGAAKAGLAAYLEGLDHRYWSEGLRVVTVKPGFVRTGMTEGLKEPPFAGEPDAVARRVLRAIDRERPVVYAPPVWFWILQVVRRLPRAVMRRVGF